MYTKLKKEIIYGEESLPVKKSAFNNSCPEICLNVEKAGGTPPVTEVLHVTEGLEGPVQFLYLGLFVLILAGGIYISVRQVLVRRKLDEAAKIRRKNACATDYFELGAVLLKKKLYAQAISNLEMSIKIWNREDVEVAQVHNALGFIYVELSQLDQAVHNFRRAVELQPGYTTAWNNLGDTYKKMGEFGEALCCYQKTLLYEKQNVVAQDGLAECRKKVQKLKNIQIR